jgi:hypothetical protein
MKVDSEKMVPNKGVGLCVFSPDGRYVITKNGTHNILLQTLTRIMLCYLKTKIICPIAYGFGIS